jgi:group II intron reverse transcriptase/maturase
MAFPRLNNISFWVRKCTLISIASKACLHFYYMLTTSELGDGENPKLNTASLLEGLVNSNQDELYEIQVVPSMVKAILPEEQFLCDSRDGLLLAWNGKNQLSKSSAKSDFEVGNLNKSTISGINGSNVQPKDGYVLMRGTFGWPKGSNAYGHGITIVPANSLLYLYANPNRLGRGGVIDNNVTLARSYSTGSAPIVTDRYVNLVERCEKYPNDTVDRDLYRFLLDPNMYLIAYHKLRSKPGNMTLGISPETLDGLSSEWIDQAIQSMRTESFQFRPSRRVNIPKPKRGTRPLSVATPRDKIVLEIMRMVLEAIFTPSFSKNSHGFMANRGCHSALRQVYMKFKGVTWVIEGDISKCFDSIDHHKLMNILENKITDRRFTKLIWKSLRAGYFEFNVYQHSITGTPQGSIISPILCNIFMNQLDQFVNNLASNFDKGVKPRLNNEYSAHASALARAKKKGETERMRTEMLAMRELSSINFYDPNFRRLYYVRYADDWIVGIRGSLEETKNILNQIDLKLSEMGLTLSNDKTKITNINKEKVLFLGTTISRSQHRRYTRMQVGTTRRLGLGIRLEAPLDRVRQKLTDAGFIENGKPHPKFIWMYLNKDQILHLYNSVYRGILNYYSFSLNINQLGSLVGFTLKESLTRLLAAKFSLNSRAQVYKKFGILLGNQGKVKFYNPKFKVNIMDFKVGPKIDIIQGLFAQSKSIANLYKLLCAKCESDYRVEMHHIKMMKNLETSKWADRLLAKSNRKQIPLCRKCHMEHHTTRH